MKNFFKKLAFVLALAMVLVSVAPATANAAAKAPSLKKTSKILYIGGDLTGTIPDSYRFYFNNAAGYTSTWESLDEDVVAIEGKTVVAVGVGKAVVKATLTNKAGKEVVREATVWVKQNAEKVGFGSQKAIESPIELGSKVKINVFRQVGDKKIWTQNDMATCTDVIKWTSSDEKVATVDKWGTVTAVGAGEATITATATQPQGPTAGESANYKVTVVSGLTAATQKDVNTVNLTFGSAVTKDKVNATTVKLYEVVGTTKVAQLVSAVTIDEKDATKATLDSYVNFKKNTTYVVEYDGKTAEFVAVDPSAESVKKVVLLTTQAVKNTPTEVKYQLLTENGVDITSEIDKSRVTIETKSTDCYFNPTDRKVTFFETGKVAPFKVVFHTYTYTENGVENVIETEGAIVSVDASSATLGTIANWTLTEDTTFDFDKKTPNQKLTLTEKTGLNFIGQYVKSDKTKVLTTEDSLFTFESSNSNVMIANGNRLYPVNTGSVTLIIKYDGKAIDAVAITVLPERVAASITATGNKSVVSRVSEDKFVINVEVKDNYGNASAGKVNLELLSTSKTGATVTINNKVATLTDGKAKFEIAGDDFKNDSSYTFKVTAGDVARIVTVEAKTPDQDTTKYNKVLNVTKNTINTTLKLTTTTGSSINADFDAKMELKIVDKNGLFVAVDKTSLMYGAQNGTANGVYYYEFYNAKGELVKADGLINGVQFLDTNTNTFSAIAASGSGVMVKAPTGTYRVQYYKATLDKDGNNVVHPLGQYFINVTDDQAPANVTLKNSVSTKNTVIAAIDNKDILITLDIDNDGKADELTGSFSNPDIVGADGSNPADQAGKTVFVKSVVYTAQVAFGNDVKSVEIKIDVNKQITLAK